MESDLGVWFNIAMDLIKDEDVGRLWELHFPKRNDVESKKICLALYRIINERAQGIVLYGSWSDILDHAVVRLGVPVDQFYQFEKEIKAS